MRLPLARQQSMQRVIDRVVHEIKRRQRKKARAYDHDKARVHLQRVIGWTFVKIERRYGVPIRTAKRWEYAGEGARVLAVAAEKGWVKREWVVEGLSIVS
jgi:hypothetical protein